jgi:predicted LPLAT superfamily acyltransferase
MLGDRAYGSPSAGVPFLGGNASFPIGAYIMASIADAPLVYVFNLREPGGHYHFFGFPAFHPKMPPREQRDDYLRNCAANFASALESILKRDPFQWYNFFPFWDSPGQSGQALPSPVSSPENLSSPKQGPTGELCPFP